MKLSLSLTLILSFERYYFDILMGQVGYGEISFFPLGAGRVLVFHHPVADEEGVKLHIIFDISFFLFDQTYEYTCVYISPLVESLL